MSLLFLEYRITVDMPYPVSKSRVWVLGQSFGEYPYFWRYPNFLKIKRRKSLEKPACKNQLDMSSRFDTNRRVTDTHTHTDTSSELIPALT